MSDEIIDQSYKSVCVCVFSAQVRAGLLLLGYVCVLHHQRVREVFRGRSLHSGKFSITHSVKNKRVSHLLIGDPLTSSEALSSRSLLMFLHLSVLIMFTFCVRICCFPE